MIYLPEQKPVAERSITISAFGGYRHDHRAGADRFFDMLNLSSDAFPLLTNRKPRKIAAKVSGNANGLCAKDALLWVDGTTLYYDGQPVGELLDTPKQMAGMGSKVVIWPDKVAYDTETGELTELGAHYVSSDKVSMTICTLDGADIDAPASDTAPAGSGGAYWIDTGETPHVLKRYSANNGRWTSIPTSYIKITAVGVGALIKSGDGVTIRGAVADVANGSFVVQDAGDDYIMIIGLLDESVEQSESIIVERNIPDMDYICEHNNRIWGCSSASHEIRCCKLGDPTNWECFQGISTDSYVLTVGSDGDFTGACAYGGNVIFFKENKIIKIMGAVPAKFALSPVECNGVATGSAASLVVANETLFYLSTAGICAYNGALPTLIGEDLAGPYSNAVAGATPTKYYVSMMAADGIWHLFVYDTLRGLWHREDSLHAAGFARLGAQLYVLDAATNQLMAIDAPEAEDEKPVPWMFETGELIVDTRYGYPKKLIIRFEKPWTYDPGRDPIASIRYDDGPFEQISYFTAHRKQIIEIPIRLRRCDSLALRISGYGDFKLHSYSLVYAEGSGHGIGC